MRRVIHCVGSVADAPCGEPWPPAAQVPSSMTPAASHLSISRRTMLPAIGCPRNFRSQARSSWPKKSRMSASGTQFTLFPMIPAASASSA